MATIGEDVRIDVGDGTRAPRSERDGACAKDAWFGVHEHQTLIRERCRSNANGSLELS